MTDVYLAATFNRRDWLLPNVVGPLMAAGHHITSKWLYAAQGTAVMGSSELAVDPAVGKTAGIECLEDIRRARAVAVFTDTPSSTGGYHVEFGYALALGKPITIVGPLLNVFHSLDEPTHHRTVTEFLRAWGAVPVTV